MIMIVSPSAVIHMFSRESKKSRFITGGVRQDIEHNSTKINKPYYSIYLLIFHFGGSLKEIQSKKKKKENVGVPGTKKIPDQITFSVAYSTWCRPI